MAANFEGSNGVFPKTWLLLAFAIQCQFLLNAFRFFRLLKQQRRQSDWADRFQSIEPNNWNRSLPSKCFRLVLSYVVHLIHASFIPLLLAAVHDWGQMYAVAFSALLLQHTLIWMLHMTPMWQGAKGMGGAEEEFLGLAVDCLVVQQAFSSNARPLALVWGAQMVVLEWGRRFALSHVMHPQTISALDKVKTVQSGKAQSAQRSLLAKGQEQSYGRATLEIVRSLELQWLVSDIDRAASSCLCLVLLAYGGLVYLMTAAATALLTGLIAEWLCKVYLASAVCILVFSGCSCYRSMRTNLWTNDAVRTVFAHQVPNVVTGRRKLRPPLWNTTCLLLSAMGTPTEFSATSNVLGDQETAGPAAGAKRKGKKPEWFMHKCPRASQRIEEDRSLGCPSWEACLESRTWNGGSLTSFTIADGYSYDRVKLGWWKQGREDVIIERWASEQPLKWMVKKWRPFIVPFVDKCVSDFTRALTSVGSSQISKVGNLLRELREILSKKVVRKVSDCHDLQDKVAHDLADWVGFEKMWLDPPPGKGKSDEYDTLKHVEGSQKNMRTFLGIQEVIGQPLQRELAKLAERFGSSELHAVQSWQEDWLAFKAESKDLSAFITVCAALCLCWPMRARQYEQPPFKQLELLGPCVVAGASGCLMLSRLLNSLAKTLKDSATTNRRGAQQTRLGPQMRSNRYSKPSCNEMHRAFSLTLAAIFNLLQILPIATTSLT